MALRRIALRDFVIVRALELDLAAGFTVLTGETGAGKSILIDALQLALGNRADAGAVREGAERARRQRRIRLPTRPWRPGWTKAASRPATRCCCAARSTPGPQPRLDQRQPGHRDAVARTRRPAAGHPRPACLAKPDAARGRARPARRLCRRRRRGARAAWQALAPGHRGAGRGALGAGLAAARTRAPASGRSARSMKLAPGADEWEELSASHTRISNAQALHRRGRRAHAARWKTTRAARSPR